MRSRWRIAILHTLRSAWACDSNAEGPIAALGEAEQRFARANPSLKPDGIVSVHVRRVHPDDDFIEGVPV